MKINKREAQKQHATLRAMQRFGLKVKPREIVKQIQEGKAHFLRRVSLRVTLWLVEIEGKRLVAVYDSKRKMIATFLYTEEDMARLTELRTTMNDEARQMVEQLIGHSDPKALQAAYELLMRPLEKDETYYDRGVLVARLYRKKDTQVVRQIDITTVTDRFVRYITVGGA